MVECPSCHNQIVIAEKYFGTLFNCPQCPAIYFVDWNGVPEPQESTPNEPEIYSPEPVATENDSIPVDLNQTDNIESQGFDTPYSFDQPMGAEDFTQKSDNETFQDVNEYANTESIPTNLVYYIRIEGIDSMKTREELKSVLSDVKFGWDVEQLFTQINSGVLALERINPIKASIILSRMESLKLQITWRQDVFI